MPENDELYRRTDGKFTVTGWREWRHASYSYRGRSRTRGDTRPSSFSAPDEPTLLTRCEAVWRAYVDGLLDTNPQERPMTLGEMVDAFVARPGLSRKTEASYARALRLFVQHAGKDLMPYAIGRRAVDSWLDGMTCGSVSKATYLRTLRAFLSHARREGWTKGDPTEGIVVRANAVLRPWLRFEEWDRFLAACWPGHRVRAGFVLETGLRAGEVMAARWTWLHTSDGRTAVRIAPDGEFTPKWGQSRAVPLSAKAMEWLDAAKGRWGTDGYIFTRDELHAPKFARETASACERSGVTKVDFHGLRRAAGARWLELGMPIQVVSRLLGHKDITTTMKWYGGISDGHLAREMDRVDAARAPVKGRKRTAKVVTLRGGNDG